MVRSNRIPSLLSTLLHPFIAFPCHFFPPFPSFICLLSPTPPLFSICVPFFKCFSPLPPFISFLQLPIPFYFSSPSVNFSHFLRVEKRAKDCFAKFPTAGPVQMVPERVQMPSPKNYHLEI